MDCFEQMLEFRFDRMLPQAYSFAPWRQAQNDKKTPLGAEEK
jgi:hypothetical protein